MAVPPLNVAVLFLISTTCAAALTRVPYVFFLSPTDLDSKPERREGGREEAGTEVTLSAKAQHMRQWQSWPSWIRALAHGAFLSPPTPALQSEHAPWPSRTTWP